MPQYTALLAGNLRVYSSVTMNVDNATEARVMALALNPETLRWQNENSKTVSGTPSDVELLDDDGNVPDDNEIQSDGSMEGDSGDLLAALTQVRTVAAACLPSAPLSNIGVRHLAEEIIGSYGMRDDQLADLIAEMVAEMVEQQEEQKTLEDNPEIQADGSVTGDNGDLQNALIRVRQACKTIDPPVTLARAALRRLALGVVATEADSD